MAVSKVQRCPIRFDQWYGPLSSVFFLPPSGSWVEVDDRDVRVRMGWAFRCGFPRTAIASVTPMQKSPISRGVHGFAGRWLVNGSGQGIVTIHLLPVQRGYVMGFPVRLRELMVSVREPAALAAVLKPARDTRPALSQGS